MKNGWLNRILLLVCVILAVLCCIATVTKNNENPYSHTQEHVDGTEETTHSAEESDEYEVSSEEESTSQGETSLEETESVTAESSSQTIEESEAGQESTQEEPAAVNPEAPVLVLSSNNVVVSAGQNFRYWDYIITLEDDKDDFEYLSSQIVLDGVYDTSVPGTYELQFWVLDSDGNSSGAQTFILTVQ